MGSIWLGVPYISSFDPPLEFFFKQMSGKVTIRDIAKKCGVSRTTVSAALRNASGVSAEQREKIQSVANKMGYVRDMKVAQVMAHIAKSGTQGHLRRIAMVSAPEVNGPPPWKANGLMNRFYNGVKAQAESLGCGFEAFWMAEPGMTSRRLAEIIYSRGIDGIVLMLDYGKDPARIDFDFSQFAVSVIGRSLEWPHLYSAEGDLHQGMLMAMDQARNYGYKRPGLMLRDSSSKRAEHSWEAAYYLAQSRLDLAERVPVCKFGFEDTELIRVWYDEYKPDVIIGHEPPGLKLLSKYKIRVPEDVAFIALEMHDPDSEIAGVDIKPEGIAAAAVDLLSEQFRKNQQGLPERPETVIVKCEWHDGKTLPFIGRK